MATYTIGGDGHFATITAALASGSVGPGDTLALLPGYNSETATVGIENLTFAGDASNTGMVLLLDTGIMDITLTGTAPITVNGNYWNWSDNLITGNDGDNSISGGAGNDSINGGGGADNLAGGAGNDSINGGAGADNIYYEAGTGTNSSTNSIGAVIADAGGEGGIRGPAGRRHRHDRRRGRLRHADYLWGPRLIRRQWKGLRRQQFPQGGCRGRRDHQH